jgi:phosphoadenosine phosphosulfate reductase
MNDLFTGKSKEEIAIERIKAFCPPEGYWLGFSGGKDSVVLLDLTERSGVKFDAHYHSTTVDPPELVRFVKTFPQVEIHHPEKTMWKLIEENGMPPTRIARYCCKILKEGGGANRFCLLGIRWGESYSRSKRKMVEPCFKDNRKYYIRPIIDWTDEDVWTYIRSNNLKYCSLYDEGWKRIGCILCPMNTNRVKQAERWPTYKKAYIKALDRALKHNKEKGLTVNHSSGEEFFNWWIQDRHKKVNSDQTVMFE